MKIWIIPNGCVFHLAPERRRPLRPPVAGRRAAGRRGAPAAAAAAAASSPSRMNVECAGKCGRVRWFHMPAAPALPPRLPAFSYLHVAFPGNREITGNLWPASAAGRLPVAGDAAGRLADIGWAPRVLGERFATVVWAAR
jgi:hypothetical protein